jgi:hypothetical protein
MIAFAAWYIPYHYKYNIIEPYKDFPEPVAKELRKAIFYVSGRQIDERESMRYFTRALVAARQCGLAPNSKESLYIKFWQSKIAEKCNDYNTAIQILEILRSDSQDFMEERADQHWTDGERTRILSCLVQVNLRLGQLYDNPLMNNPVLAERRLVEAVELALKERARRTRDGEKEGETRWFNDEELAFLIERTSSQMLTHIERLHTASRYRVPVSHRSV